MFQIGEDGVIRFDPTRTVSLQVDGCENTEISIVYYKREVTDAWWKAVSAKNEEGDKAYADEVTRAFRHTGCIAEGAKPRRARQADKPYESQWGESVQGLVRINKSMMDQALATSKPTMVVNMRHRI